MSFGDQNSQIEQEIKEKIDKLKSSINESLGLSNIKLNELEKELQEFQTELHSSAQTTVTDQSVESDKLLRLYKAERSLNDLLQQKIIDLEKEVTEIKTSNKTMKSTEELLQNVKNFFASELAKITSTKSMPPDPGLEAFGTFSDDDLGKKSSIETLISKENKANKEERQRLESENQDLNKELMYYKDRNENLKKELQFRNQEIQSYKKIMHEQEEEEQEEQESYLSRKGINDEYGFTLEEEFELTKEELNTLKGKYLTLEHDNEETIKQIDSYKKELTDLKRVLGDKNNEIRQLKRGVQPEGEEQYEKEELEQNKRTEIDNQLTELKTRITTLESQLEESQKLVNVAESQNREFQNSIKKLEEKSTDKEVLDLQVHIDKLSKAVWKIEKTINIFDSPINVDAETFNRHIEVYGLLLGKIFNARGYALVIDTLLKHKGKALTKKMVMTESRTEPHTAIRVLRELHDSKIIHFDEEMDQIIWR